MEKLFGEYNDMYWHSDHDEYIQNIIFHRCCDYEILGDQIMEHPHDDDDDNYNGEDDDDGYYWKHLEDVNNDTYSFTCPGCSD